MRHCGRPSQSDVWMRCGNENSNAFRSSELLSQKLSQESRQPALYMQDILNFKWKGLKISRLVSCERREFCFVFESKVLMQLLFGFFFVTHVLAKRQSQESDDELWIRHEFDAKPSWPKIELAALRNSGNIRRKINAGNRITIRPNQSGVRSGPRTACRSNCLCLSDCWFAKLSSTTLPNRKRSWWLVFY